MSDAPASHRRGALSDHPIEGTGDRMQDNYPVRPELPTSAELLERAATDPISQSDALWFAADLVATALIRGYPGAVELADGFANLGVKLPLFHWPDIRLTFSREAVEHARLAS